MVVPHLVRVPLEALHARGGLSSGPESVRAVRVLAAGDWPDARAQAPSDGDVRMSTAELLRRIRLLGSGEVRLVADPAVAVAPEMPLSSGDLEADAAALLEACRAETASAGPERRLVAELRDTLAAELGALVQADADARRRLFDLLAVAEEAWAVPWDRLRPPASMLAVLYNFQPFADTGSTVASKRLRVHGRTADVVSCSFLHHKKIDPTVGAIARPYIARHRYLDLRPAWSSWHAFAEFAHQARDQATAWIAEGASYEVLYTRANWAPSHYAGALIKESHPELSWIAEFSDPLSLDVEGYHRGALLDRDEPLLSRLTAPVEERYGRIPDQYFSIFGLAEILPYAMADTVQFTNELQREAMLDHIYSPALADRVHKVSEVSHHPTLPPAYYAARPVEYAVDPSLVNIAYFGEFYVTRGITDVTLGMAMLPEEVRQRIRLHVFTNFVPEGGLSSRPPGFSKAQFEALVCRARDGVGAVGLEDLVEFNASLPYLEFLAATGRFDLLVVNDAQSGPLHEVNPFLPSKWSDYRGSSADVWAIVEDGSMLSTMPTAVRTRVGDPVAARAVLWDLVETKRGGDLQ